jgi:multicomponent Na+:H+ antiporter subunit E
MGCTAVALPVLAASAGPTSPVETAGLFLGTLILTLALTAVAGAMGVLPKRATALAFALMGSWLLWSGHTESLILGFGVFSVLLVVVIAHRMRIIDEEGVPLSIHTAGEVTYVPWLIWQVVLSNIDVARRIWSADPTAKLEPSMLSVTPSQKTFVGRVLYANSITLTPGTVSIRMYDDEILVHALHAGTASDVSEGEMDRRVSAVERTL